MRRKPRTKTQVRCTVDVEAEILKRGFCRMQPADYAMPKKLMLALGTLTEEGRDLPVDPRAESGERRRRYGRFVYLPWADSLSLRPVTTYYQDATVNSDDGGVSREFAPLTPALQQNKFLTNLIRLDFEQLPVTGEQLTLPWDVGIHLIQMFARPGSPGISSPDRPHKDTEPFTFVHLLERKDVTGGVSAVYGNAEVVGACVPGEVLFEGTLSGAMDSLVVKDDAVFHQARRVELVPGAAEGYRLVLLIDFTPMLPRRNEYPNLG